MNDYLAYILAALLILVGSHLLLWAWLKRKIAAVARDIERERAAGADAADPDEEREGR